MNPAKIMRFDNPAGKAVLHCGWVTGIEDDYLVIDHALEARQAASLPLEPKLGDHVMFVETGKERFVLSILASVEPENASLKFPGAKRLKMVAEHVDIIGTETVSLSALSELSLKTCRNLKVSCMNFLHSATESMVSITRNWMMRCDQGAVEAKDLLRTDAANQIITASKDMRLDAERINMG